MYRPVEGRLTVISLYYGVGDLLLSLGLLNSLLVVLVEEEPVGGRISMRRISFFASSRVL
jgi:hypothetical protein